MVGFGVCCLLFLRITPENEIRMEDKFRVKTKMVDIKTDFSAMEGVDRGKVGDKTECGERRKGNRTRRLCARENDLRNLSSLEGSTVWVLPKLHTMNIKNGPHGEPGI